MTLADILASIDAVKRGMRTNPGQTALDYGRGTLGGIADMAGTAYTGMTGLPTDGPATLRKLMGSSQTPVDDAGANLGFPGLGAGLSSAKAAALLGVGVPKTILRDIYLATLRKGGSTTDLATGESIKHGYSVATTPKQTTFPADEFRQADLDKFVRDNLGMKKLGTWNDPETGLVYLDPIETPKAPFAAKLQAARNEQIGAYNLDTGKVLPPFDYGPPVDNVPLKPNRTTVIRPKGKAYPQIYDDPRLIADRAAAQVAPESPMLKQLFGVDRHDLDAMQLLEDNTQTIPKIYQPTRPPAHVAQVTTPGNAGRLQDILSYGLERPELAGSYGWYQANPLAKTFVEILGPEEGMRRYLRFRQMGSGLSPMSDVSSEIGRSSLAYTMDMNPGGLERFIGTENIPAGLGHIAHNSAHASAIQRLIDTGDFASPNLSQQVKTRNYFLSNTGQQSHYPTGDAHFVRGVGLADVRPYKTIEGGVLVPDPSSIGATEFAPVGDWFSKKVAAPLGIAGSPAQAAMWNILGPATGVETGLSKPFLELFGDRVKRAADRLNISPEQAMHDWITGKGDYLGLGDPPSMDGSGTDSGQIANAA